MIRRSKSSLVLFLCLQAMAVAIICLGSLINFHQYKIWGKPLIPQFVGLKRDVEKATKILSNGNLVIKSNLPQKFSTLSSAILPVEILRHSSGTAGFITIDLCYKGPGF